MSEHFDWFLRAEMDSFTLNTTASDHFRTFEFNGTISCSSEIQELLLRPRQQGSPYSIDMIERYQLTLWKVRTVKISTTTAMQWRWRQIKEGKYPLHFRQQDHSCSIDMIERYQ